MNDQKKMQELERLAEINGRTVSSTGRRNDQGEMILTTSDYPGGDDAAIGTAEELLTWERGYVTAIRAGKGKL